MVGHEGLMSMGMGMNAYGEIGWTWAYGCMVAWGWVHP